MFAIDSDQIVILFGCIFKKDDDGSSDTPDRYKYRTYTILPLPAPDMRLFFCFESLDM
jgi:hypothetical protein